MTRRLVNLGAIIGFLAAMASLSAAPPTAAPSAGGDLLRLEETTATDLEPSPIVLRQRRASLNLDGVRALVPGRALRLNLFDDATLDAVVDRMTPRPAGGLVGQARLVGIPFGSFTFVLRGDVLAGVVHAPGHGTFDVTRDELGRTLVRELDEARRDPCGVNDATRPTPAAPRGVPPCPYSVSKLAGYAADDGETIDVMVVYTAAARDQAGSDAVIQARIDTAAATMNTTLMNSAIAPRIRVVHTALIDYTESGDLLTDLDRLAATADGHGDTVHADRDTHGADLVQLWVSYTTGAGGAGFSLFTLGPEDDGRAGFSVARQDNYAFETLAHELGHNFGCQHDRLTNPTGGFFNYSYGFREPGSLWKTVMAYPPGDTILYFSNPDVTYTGPLGNHGPTGVPGDNPATSCNNALTIANTAWTVANFRPSTLESAPPSRLYVRPAAPPGGDGSSWAAAVQDAQDGFARAVQSRGAVSEVWVAAGVYKPDRGVTDPAFHRKLSFRLVEDVTIYGGFNGTETLLSQRDVVANETVLSGDIGTIGVTADNSYHVIDGTDLGPTAVLDGFTITAGNANGAYPHDIGGGMRNVCGGPTLRNCTFTGNHAGYAGGAVGNRFGATPVFVDCTFSANAAVDGGGAMLNDASSPSLSGCSFDGNSALHHGAIENHSGSAPTLAGCTFTANTGELGGAIGYYNTAGSLTGCTFTMNAATAGGGALDCGSGGLPELTDCHFNSNTAGFGGGLYCHNGGDAILDLCTFSGNSADDGGAVYVVAASPTLTTCTFTQNEADVAGDGAGAAVFVSSGSPEFDGCLFDDNEAGCCGGAFYNFAATPIVRRSDFIDNDADFGGAVLCLAGSNAVHTNCRFLHNAGVFGGGAAYISGSAPQFINCAFTGNGAAQNVGGALLNAGSNPQLINCSLSGNTAGFGAGGIYNDNASPIIRNGILWQNTDGNGAIESSQITQAGGASSISYSIVQGWTGSFGGAENSGANPLFVDPDGGDNIFGTLDDNLRVPQASPCVDSGQNSAVPTGVTTDLDGNPRFADLPCLADDGDGTPPIVDRGAYELIPLAEVLGDFDDSGTVTTADVPFFVAVLIGTDTNPARVAAADMNCDGLADGADIRPFEAELLTP